MHKFQRGRLLKKGPLWPPSLNKTQATTWKKHGDQSFSSDLSIIRDLLLPQPGGGMRRSSWRKVLFFQSWHILPVNIALFCLGDECPIVLGGALKRETFQVIDAWLRKYVHRCLGFSVCTIGLARSQFRYHEVRTHVTMGYCDSVVLEMLCRRR